MEGSDGCGVLGQRLTDGSLVVVVSKALRKPVHDNGVVVEHEHELECVGGHAIEHVRKTGTECVAATAKPQAEQRPPVRVGEIDAGGKSEQPSQPYPEWDEMSPKVAHIVVRDEDVPQAGLDRGTFSAVASENVGFLVDTRDLLLGDQKIAETRSSHIYFLCAQNTPKVVYVNGRSFSQYSSDVMITCKSASMHLAP